jgi:hypothetical protein
VLILDSGGVIHLAERSRRAVALMLELRARGRWPASVPSVVLVERLHGHPRKDALTDRFVRSCDVLTGVPEPTARRAALLRRKARRGSAVDELVVAFAEPGGRVLTSDLADLAALAAHADDVRAVRV